MYIHTHVRTYARNLVIMQHALYLSMFSLLLGGGIFVEVELGRSADRFVRFVESAESYQEQAISLVSHVWLSSTHDHTLQQHTCTCRLCYLNVLCTYHILSKKMSPKMTGRFCHFVVIRIGMKKIPEGDEHLDYTDFFLSGKLLESRYEY